MSTSTDKAAISTAVEILASGGVVAFPTETVYGLGADAANETAVRRVFAIKGRPADHPLIVHLASAAWLERWARHVPEAALKLAEAFWPGPLTLVLPRQPWVLDAVTGGQDSVALRVPSHPIALELIAAAGALVAPSANRFGRVSPTTADHVRDELGGSVDYILDGGPCAWGVESTIVSLLEHAPRILRPGGISPPEIEAVLAVPVPVGKGDVRAPGLLPAHYAPATALELHTGASLVRRASALVGAGRKVAALILSHATAELPDTVRQVAMPVEAASYARMLYATLRAMDMEGYDVLLVERPPDGAEWLAVSDRLQRAANASLPELGEPSGHGHASVQE